MKYVVSNGITHAVEITEDQARVDYDAAPRVVGTFGRSFVTYPIGEYGRVLTCAATTYEPIKEAPRRPRRRSP